MRIGRMHPVANWLRCQGDDYTHSMDQVLGFRDQAMALDPSASGLPPAAIQWFWTEQLPQLLRQPHYRHQAEQHLEALKLKSTDLGEMIERTAGQLLNDQAETDQQISQLQAVLEATNG